jgi:osmoprotectant transport system ATP-binding protein
VLRTGGVLAQYDEPGRLLARPADDFVDGFVGRDRGYRGLGFLSSAALPLGELSTVTLGESLPDGAGWVLVVDGAQQPLGWIHGSGRNGAPTVEHDHLIPGGSLYEVESGSLRSALDAALSSPSGQGVAVDGTGSVAGSVSADDVLRALEDARPDPAAA